MVGSAGGPLGGDDLRLGIDVGAGCRLRVRSAAATVALPGPTGAPSCFRLAVRIAAGGRFEWRPEPTVIAHRAHHEITLDVRIAAGGCAVVREILVLGRLGEPPGTVRSRLGVWIDGAPLLLQDTLVGAAGLAGWAGPAGLRGARVLGSVLLAGAVPADDELPASVPRRSCCRLAGPGYLVTAWGADTLAVTALLGDR